MEVELANLCGKSFCCLFDGVGSFGNRCNGVFSLLASLYDDWCIHGCIKTMTSSNNQYLGLSKYDRILVRFFLGGCGLGLVASKHVLVTICAIPLAFDNVGMSVCALSKQTNKQTKGDGVTSLCVCCDLGAEVRNLGMNRLRRFCVCFRCCSVACNGAFECLLYRI